MFVVRTQRKTSFIEFVKKRYPCQTALDSLSCTINIFIR